jgi:hypothetical protein
MDAMVTEARVFEEAYSASSWTAPSVNWYLSADASEGNRLQDRLVAAGYTTACFTDNPHLGRTSGLTAGFDRVGRSVGDWRGLLHGTVLGKAIQRISPGNDRILTDRALAWATAVDGPLFLYVHLMDSHAPYDSPPIDGIERPGRKIEFPKTGMKISAVEVDDIIARFDGGIRSADAQAGRLVSAARSWGRPFVVLVTSDHGESLGEGNRWYHGKSLAPELLAVPLLVIGEDVESGRVRIPVGFSSITKTFLAAAEIACSDCPGSDLRTSDGDGVAQGVLPPHARFVISDGHKLLVDERQAVPSLFDMAADPGETLDIASEHPDLVARLFELLPGHRELPEPAAEDIERLKALGYLSN